LTAFGQQQGGSDIEKSSHDLYDDEGKA
jgi:hypothetical protein